MGSGDFDSMSLDELWSLREELATTLAERLASEKLTLEARLKQLRQPGFGARQKARNVTGDGRRAYPAVMPKYRSPHDPYETWSGRGRQPRWLIAQLKAGKEIDDFLISPQPSNVSAISRKATNG